MGSPEHLRREGFDIRWFTLAPRALTGAGIAANAPRRLGSPTTRRPPSPQQPCTPKSATTGGTPAVRSASASRGPSQTHSEPAPTCRRAPCPKKCRARRSRTVWQPSSSAESWVPLSVPEIRRLFWRLVLATRQTIGQILDWSAWRRWHPGVAQYYLYKRRRPGS